MSFDIIVGTCRYSGPPETRENPFTGQPTTFIPQESLNPDEVKAVQNVLKQVDARDTLDGSYDIRLADGSMAEISTDDVAEGGMISLHGLTQAMCQFLFNFLQAGQWVMQPIMAEPLAITTAPDRIKGVDESFPRIVECKSPEELRLLLSKGVEAWEQYCRHVAG